MKKLFVFGAALFILVSGVAAQEIVFVNMEEVFNRFYKTQLAKSKMSVQQKEIEEERQSMIDEMKLISDEVDVLKKEARDVTLAQEIRDQKRILFEERVLEMREKEKESEDFIKSRGEQLRLQMTRMSRTIMDEIREGIVEYARREGLKAVVDSSNRGAPMSVFIYTHPDVDVTEDILAMINSKRPDLDAEAGLSDESSDAVEEQEGTSEAE